LIVYVHISVKLAKTIAK